MRVLLLFVAILLFARENPFVPIVTNNNKIIKKTYFKSTKIQLPSDARIIKNFIITYQTLNGSIKQYKVNIEKSIDWHNPIFVSTKLVKIPSEIVKIHFLKFKIQNHDVFIYSTDKMIRSFFLVEPFRFVIDFKANKDFLTYKKTTPTFIKSIVLGNHSGFYRVVLNLDGKYKVKIKKLKEGYLLEFR